MRTLVKKGQMRKAGTILVEELDSFLNCDEEELQILFDGPSNPDYYYVLEHLNPVTFDDRFLIINDDSILITETAEEFKLYSNFDD